MSDRKLCIYCCKGTGPHQLAPPGDERQGIAWRAAWCVGRLFIWLSYLFPLIWIVYAIAVATGDTEESYTHWYFEDFIRGAT